MSLDSLAEVRFVSLTAFRKTGVPVSTPVWIARDGDALLVTTPDTSGKVKRLRNSPRVELRPCDRRGNVAEGAPVTEAVASIEDSDDRTTAIFLRKYRVEYRIVMLIERIVKKANRHRAILRITER
jgi:PPOX class probable F420-dependent enzyme